MTFVPFHSAKATALDIVMPRVISSSSYAVTEAPFSKREDAAGIFAVFRIAEIRRGLSAMCMPDHGDIPKFASSVALHPALLLRSWRRAR